MEVRVCGLLDLHLDRVLLELDEPLRDVLDRGPLGPALRERRADENAGLDRRQDSGNLQRIGSGDGKPLPVPLRCGRSFWSLAEESDPHRDGHRDRFHSPSAYWMLISL